LWLTPLGRIGTVVKGAVRPKSAFLGQYDLNYTCEIVYYARAKGDLHALRECAPLNRRDALRDDYASLALAGYFRFLSDRFAPQGSECAEWYEMLVSALDDLCVAPLNLVITMMKAELRYLHLLGLDPEVEADSGAFVLRGERKIPISPEVAAFIRVLSQPSTFHFQFSTSDVQAPVALDAARALGVYYNFHVDGVSDVRRAVLRMIQNKVR